jgi:methylenetetrahydrofolate reductase (NADPH)
MCGAGVPEPLAAKLEMYATDDVACVEFGIEYATQQCAELLQRGAVGLHFYTLNKARSTTQILCNLCLPGH